MCFDLSQIIRLAIFGRHRARTFRATVFRPLPVGSCTAPCTRAMQAYRRGSQ